MFPVRLTHPLHGATHAYDSHELERLKKAGWSDSETAKVVLAPKPKRAYHRKAA